MNEAIANVEQILDAYGVRHGELANNFQKSSGLHRWSWDTFDVEKVLHQQEIWKWDSATRLYK